MRQGAHAEAGPADDTEMRVHHDGATPRPPHKQRGSPKLLLTTARSGKWLSDAHAHHGVMQECGLQRRLRPA